jgi:predicted Fe-Mo cluster-binding NifX family protein
LTILLSLAQSMLYIVMSTQHTQRIAVTVWNGRVSPVFDTAREMLLVDLSDGTETARHLAALGGVCPAERTARLRELGVSTVICGAVSRPMAAWCATEGIRLVPFTAGDADEVIAAWIAGLLPDDGFRMPGCHGQGRGRGCGRRQRRQKRHAGPA